MPGDFEGLPRSPLQPDGIAISAWAGLNPALTTMMGHDQPAVGDPSAHWIRACHGSAARRL